VECVDSTLGQGECEAVTQDSKEGSERTQEGTGTIVRPMAVWPQPALFLRALTRYTERASAVVSVCVYLSRTTTKVQTVW